MLYREVSAAKILKEWKRQYEDAKGSKGIG
jgi:hypothetical protein